MSEQLFLFKRESDGAWIFGLNNDCEHPSGICRVVPSTDRTTISIIYIQKNEANENHMHVPFGNFLDSTGTPYATFNALKTAYNGFFIGSINSGSVAAAAGFTAFEITVVEDQTDYALPLEADVAKDWIVSADGVGFSPSTDYTKSLVDGVPTISFNVAPTVGNVPVVWYQKSSQTLELLILRTIQNPGNAFAIDVSENDFEPSENTPFLIKNDSDDTVTLEVKYADGTDWISTKFKVGWNEDLVKAVKTNVTVMDLKGGVR